MSINFLKTKISESINFIFSSEKRDYMFYLKLSELKKTYKNVMSDDFFSKEDKIEISKFLSLFLRKKMKEELVIILKQIFVNKEKNISSLVNTLYITENFYFNKNKIILMSYAFIDLIEFNCKFFYALFNIKDFINRIDNTNKLIDDSVSRIENIFNIKDLKEKDNKMMNYVFFKKNIISNKNDYCFSLINNESFFIYQNDKIIVNDIFKVFLDIFFSVNVNDIDLNNTKNELEDLFGVYDN